MTALAAAPVSVVQPAPAGRRILMADLAAEHQIIIRYTARPDRGLMVSCNCLAYTRPGRPGHVPIEDRQVFPADELWAAWARWHAERGIQVGA